MLELTNGLSEMQSPGQYAGWLWDTLTDFYPNSNEVNRNSRLYKFIEEKELESPVEALNIIYEDHLSSAAKTDFRHAIGISLHKCTETTDKRAFNILSDLVYLAARTGAVEAFDSLLEVNSDEFIANNHDRILFETMGVEFTRNLVDGPFFDDGYLFEAIETMVGCKPDSYGEIVNGYGERIQRFYGAVHGDKDEESAYWDGVNDIFVRHPEVKEMIHSFSKA